MRKYRIYSGTKPTSADKTFAVNWGGKYFTVSPITAIQYVPSLTLSNISTSGNTLSVTCSNNGNDSTKMTPYTWYCSNENVNSGSNQSLGFSDTTARIFGPNTSMAYSWDASSALKPGTNVVSASFQSTPASDYQTGSMLATTNKLTIYKKYVEPVVTSSVSFSNTTFDASKLWNYDKLFNLIDLATCSFNVKNPNEVSGYLYEGTTLRSSLAANSTVLGENKYNTQRGNVAISATTTSTTLSSSVYYLDSNPSNSNVKSAGGSASKTIPAAPQLISYSPSSTTSSSFQITIKNNNLTEYFCYLTCRQNTSSSATTWVRYATCPANGTGTLTTNSGSAYALSLSRNTEYVVSMYFYSSANGALNGAQTQVSPKIHYYIKTPDSGYLYTSPVVMYESYNDDTNPTRVTFSIANLNSTALYCEMDLYQGQSTSGTRVDYWTMSVGAKGYNTCPNTWAVTIGNYYTLRCYFMTSDTYHGTAVTGYTDYTFYVQAES